MSVTRPGAMLTVLCAAHCGARTPLPRDDEASAEPATPIAEAEIIVLSAETFQGQSLIRGFEDMTGTGFVSYEGDGSFHNACDPVFDAEGRLYFVDAGEGGPRIVRLDLETGAMVTRSADAGAAADIAFDAEGRLYYPDPLLHRIVRIDDMDGNGLVSFGGPSPGAGVGQLDEPKAIAVMDDGRILVADGENQRVVQIDDIGGAGWQTWQVPVGLGETIAAPHDVAVDDQGRIYVADFASSELHRIDAIDGSGHVLFEHGKTNQLSHVFIASDGRIYLGMLNFTHSVAVMDDMQGTGLLSFSGPPGAPLVSPCGIVVR